MQERNEANSQCSSDVWAWAIRFIVFVCVCVRESEGNRSFLFAIRMDNALPKLIYTPKLVACARVVMVMDICSSMWIKCDRIAIANTQNIDTTFTTWQTANMFITTSRRHHRNRIRSKRFVDSFIFFFVACSRFDRLSRVRRNWSGASEMKQKNRNKSNSGKQSISVNKNNLLNWLRSLPTSDAQTIYIVINRTG